MATDTGSGWLGAVRPEAIVAAIEELGYTAELAAGDEGDA